MISEKMVDTLCAIIDARTPSGILDCVQLLSERIEVPYKVALRRVQKAYIRGYAECGFSERRGWITKKGNAALTEWHTENMGEE